MDLRFKIVGFLIAPPLLRVTDEVALSIPRSTPTKQIVCNLVTRSAFVKSKSHKNPNVSVRVNSAIKELRALQNLLQFDDLDPRAMGDFRDALNAVRNSAWAAQQASANKFLGHSPDSMASLLAAQRVRAAYLLCRSIGADLEADRISFQRGQLAELSGVVRQLAEQLKEKL